MDPFILHCLKYLESDVIHDIVHSIGRNVHS